MANLEIACFDLPSAIIAQQNGANRIELCDNWSVGGTTPPPTLVRQAIDQLQTTFFVMIRPRGGNFCYSKEEIYEMETSIIAYKEKGVKGFVFGALTENNQLDLAVNKALINLAAPYPCTLHRAFDKTPDIFATLEKAISCGFSTILSSGGEKDAVSGLDNLKKMVRLAKDQIVVMPGGGVRSDNLLALKTTGAHYFHSSAIVPNSTIIANGEEISKMKQLLV